jgi:hypothetical protein
MESLTTKPLISARDNYLMKKSQLQKQRNQFSMFGTQRLPLHLSTHEEFTDEMLISQKPSQDECSEYKLPKAVNMEDSLNLKIHHTSQINFLYPPIDQRSLDGENKKKGKKAKLRILSMTAGSKVPTLQSGNKTAKNLEINILKIKKPEYLQIIQKQFEYKFPERA